MHALSCQAMGQEIERKFLLRDDAWRHGAKGTPIRQGYLSRLPTVRVRIKGESALLTVKSQAEGLVRSEFEYPVPLKDAEEMLGLCEKPLIEKIRYGVNVAGHLWEIDEFYGDNAGLILAEIELEHEHESFERPAWLGEEVTGDLRYYNVCLAESPFTAW